MIWRYWAYVVCIKLPSEKVGPLVARRGPLAMCPLMDGCMLCFNSLASPTNGLTAVISVCNTLRVDGTTVVSMQSNSHFTQHRY